MESSAIFEGDVLLKATEDGGEIDITDGLITCDRGFSTAVYLSLFGGNEEDDGKVENDKTYWGNLISGTKANEKDVSRFQNIIKALPMSVKNIKLACDAAALDLAWMKDTDIADEILISSSIGGKNMLNLIVKVNKDGTTLSKSEYSIHWEAMSYGV
jgi:phage gp46-like protein